jgi:glycosyltransferase involved in cell wall biosynthesis
VRVLYLITAPPPAVEGTDAVVQEAELLRARFGGKRAHLAPSPKPWSRFPRPLYGLQMLPSLRRLERSVDLHHLYHAELYPFPVLRLLRKPVVYTVVSGLDPERLPSTRFLARLGAIALPIPRDRERLLGAGFTRGHVVPAGIDVSRYTCKPAEPHGTFVLLVGSAPWTREQFRTKGLDALLELARRRPSLRLVILWRGWLLAELQQRIASLGVAGQVEVVTERIDVALLLDRIHAAVVLAEEGRLVKAFPHSLLEALACGRPVLLSDRIAMADYVDETECGCVVRGIDVDALQEGLRRLEGGYDRLQANARRVGQRDFSQERLVERYRELYESVLAPGPQRSHHASRGRG